jgi:hypothetical protein
MAIMARRQAETKGPMTASAPMVARRSMVTGRHVQSDGRSRAARGAAAQIVPVTPWKRRTRSNWPWTGPPRMTMSVALVAISWSA